ncbi:MAG: hypothetical protein EOP92_01380 [Lysobacteraceae bacterium]|nr:MAG: hypothetical protein EOP92_01380 [Xanthomonadaceae bacterium]
MNALKVVLLALLVSPCIAMANDDAAPASSVSLPGVMTTAGHKFANYCNDDAFELAADQGALAKKCAKLLARWQAEATMRIERSHNPRLVAVLTPVDSGAKLPFDTVAALRGDPFAGF